MKQIMAWFSVSIAAAVLSSCSARYSNTSKQETRLDGTLTKESQTTISGAWLPEGGAVSVNARNVEVTANGSGGATTTTPAPGTSVPLPSGTTSVETKETVKPHACPVCGDVHEPPNGRLAQIKHRHRPQYHRFERYVPMGEWEGFLFAEDASLAVSGEPAARALWRELVLELANGFSRVPALKDELGDVRFYGMRIFEEAGQLYLSFCDIRPFQSLDLTLTEVGTANSASYGLDTPGAFQSYDDGWHVATIPISFVPSNLEDPLVELVPVIRSVGTPFTKGYVRELGW